MAMGNSNYQDLRSLRTGEGLLPLSEYPSLKNIPRFGYKKCLECGAVIRLTTFRDIEQKKYCSLACTQTVSARYLAKRMEDVYRENQSAKSRECSICGSTFPLTGEFFYFRIRKNGKEERSRACRVCRNIGMTASRKKRYKTGRNEHLIRTYGITEAEFCDMLLQQQGLCAICRCRKAKAIDHDHATGRVRGVLCHGCNSAIGVFNEDPEVFQRALDYLGVALIPVQGDPDGS